MDEGKAKKDLPACPVKTTLTPHRGYVEGSDPTGFDAGNNAFWRTEKVGRQCVSEGLDRPTPGDGEKRTGSSGGLCRGAAEGRVFADGTWKKPETHSGLHVGMGEAYKTKQ